MQAEEKFRIRGKFLYEVQGERPGVSKRESRSALSTVGRYGASEPVVPVCGKARQYLARPCWTDRVELAGNGVMARTTVSAKKHILCAVKAMTPNPNARLTAMAQVENESPLAHLDSNISPWKKTHDP